MENIRQHIENHKKEAAEYRRFFDLYKGKHSILETKQQRAHDKANNKIVNNFYGLIVDTNLGYFLGQPVVITHDKSEKIQEALDYIKGENEFNDLLAEIGKQCSIKGKSYMLVYQNEEGETRLSRLDAENTIVFKSRMTGRVKQAIHYYSEMNINGDLEHYAEVYDEKKVKFYQLINGEYRLQNEIEHIFKRCPIIEFVNNEEEMSDFEKVETLVDAYDNTLSNLADEHEEHRNAYMVFVNQAVDEETAKLIRENGMIELFGEEGEKPDVFFLTKEVRIENIKTTLDIYAANIHKFSETPDLSDENFAGNLSGVAIKFKLIDLENKTIIKERKFTRALKDLLRLLAIPIQIKTGEKVNVSDFDFQFKRNLPNNLFEIVQIVNMLEGVVDKDTQLSLLPFVNDPKVVRDKLEAERDEGYPNFHDIIYNDPGVQAELRRREEAGEEVA